MLGSELAAMSGAAGWEVQVFDLPEWDITRKEDLATAVNSASVLVNCAAYTAVDQAETESELCRQVNAEAPGRLGELVASAGKYLIHLSTDFVFGDDGEVPLTEAMPPNPLNVYGASKLAGEQALAESGCRHAVLRVEWTYGRHGSHFIDKILAAAKVRPELRVVADQFGAPTWTRDVARALLRLAALRSEGCYHFAATGYASRYEVARFILAEKGLATPVVPCRSEDFPSPALRPRNSRFDCRRIDALLKIPRPAWQDSLREFLANR